MNNNIVIITEKQSVVVRGIEKKLAEEGFEISRSKGDPGSVRPYLESHCLFVMYLGGDILDNKSEISNLDECCSMIRRRRRPAVLIGEKKYHDDLRDRVPSIKAFPWIDRPVDMNTLLNIIWEYQSSEEDTGVAQEAVLAGAPLPFPEKLEIEEEGEVSELAASIEAQLHAIKESEAEEKKERILIVDDDPSFAKMVKEWLRETYKVDIVTNGMKAITFLLKQRVDLVLLDYEMPVVDGPGVLEMMRSEQELADIPVIFLTGVGDMESVKRVMHLKPKGYVLKSTTKEALLEYIEGIK